MLPQISLEVKFGCWSVLDAKVDGDCGLIQYNHNDADDQRQPWTQNRRILEELVSRLD
jgi:hypothetical protein